MNNPKMYIAVRDDFPDYMVPTLVAHSVLGYHLNIEEFAWEYTTKYLELYADWVRNSFKKCVIKVNEKEFDKIKNIEFSSVFCENNTLGGRASCAVIVVDEEVPNVLKFAKLWKPN